MLCRILCLSEKLIWSLILAERELNHRQFRHSWGCEHFTSVCSWHFIPTVICASRLKFFDHIAYADMSMDYCWAQLGPSPKRMELCIWSTTSHLAPDGPVRPYTAHHWPGNRLSWAQLTSMERPCRNSNVCHWTGHVMILPRHLCCTLILSLLLNTTKQVKSDLLIDLLHR